MGPKLEFSDSAEAKEICPITREQCFELIKPDVTAKCPVCKQSFLGHEEAVVRELRQRGLSTTTSTSTFKPFSSSSDDAPPVSSTRSHYGKFDVPKFRSDSVCVPYLRKLGIMLRVHNVPPSEWTKSLLMAFEESYRQEWVDKNIVQAGLTWSEAKAAFTEHFQSSDYSLTVVQ